VIAAAGYRRTDCTGSAFVIDAGDRGRSGNDLYVWAFDSAEVPNYSAVRARVAGVELQYDRTRAVWRTRGRNIWVEAGPTTMRLLPVDRLRKLVEATVTTR
jgi:hypothetical protein